MYILLKTSLKLVFMAKRFNDDFKEKDNFSLK